MLSPWSYIDISSCCRQSVHAFTSRYHSTLFSCTILHRRCFCMCFSIYTGLQLVGLITEKLFLTPQYAHVFAHVFVYVYIRVCVYVCVYVYVRVCICVCTHVLHACVYTCVCICVCMCVYICVHVQYVLMYVLVYVCTCVCMCVCTHASVYMCLCVQVCVDYVCSLSHDRASYNMLFLDVHFPYLTSKKGDDSGEPFYSKRLYMFMSHITSFSQVHGIVRIIVIVYM